MISSEPVVVHRGKRRLLYTGGENAKRTLKKDQEIIRTFFKVYGRFQAHLEKAINSVYEEAVNNIAKYVTTQWQENQSPDCKF